MSARRQANGNSESVDNYLKAILYLGGPEERRVTSKSLADRLRVAPASVTNMLQKLAAAASPLVEYERHRGVLLSPAGKRRALEVLRHHRLIETFLYEILDYPIEEVHDEAERLEHFISERFEERIAAKLGNPMIDPHGHSIPTMEGVMSSQSTMLLADVAEGGDLRHRQRLGQQRANTAAAEGERHHAGRDAACQQALLDERLLGEGRPLRQAVGDLARSCARHTHPARCKIIYSQPFIDGSFDSASTLA